MIVGNVRRHLWWECIGKDWSDIAAVNKKFVWNRECLLEKRIWATEFLLFLCNNIIGVGCEVCRQGRLALWIVVFSPY